MRNNKLLMRLLCAFLSVLMLVSMAPAIAASVEENTENTETGTTETPDTPATGEGEGEGEGEGGSTVNKAPGTSAGIDDPTQYDYLSPMGRLDYMKKYYDDGEYSLYCDEALGVVAYRKNATNEIIFTNPWDMQKEISKVDTVRNELMSQVILTFIDSKDVTKTLVSYADATLKGQMSVSAIKNGVRVEYALGETSARILVPMRIEANAFIRKILNPLITNMTNKRDLAVFQAYFSHKKYATETNQAKKDAIAKAYPICEEKNIDIYVYNSTPTTKELRRLEAMILTYCPDYSFEELDSDYDYVKYEEEATSPPVFRLALEYTIDKKKKGLSVSLPANGLRYDETAYRITELQILPFMGASYKGNIATDMTGESYEGYSFIPDGSGTLYSLTTSVGVGLSGRVYGEDYALFSKVSGSHGETMRMPVFGQSVTHTAADGTKTSQGYLAIIEEGESLASIIPMHNTKMFAAIIPSFITRQMDTSKSGWSVYAYRRYTEDYRLRYIILSDDKKAEAAGLDSYYECSWMGMACAYRDYLDESSEGFNRLTAEDVKDSIPLYIETFGCVDTIEKVMSMPVTVSVALTSFKDVETMYNYLAGEGVGNINFKLKGYANGGLYSDVPYKLKWEKSVGGKSGFKELLEVAKREGFGVYPDFDFVYTTGSDGGSKVNMKKHGARTIDNRYTAKRVYSATQQTMVSHFQMVISPAVYSRFYEKLAAKYSKYDAEGISLSTFGSALNSDYDEEKTTLREEAKQNVIEALKYFKDNDYDVMVDNGNAFTWSYVDHILGVPLDSSRYTAELHSVPFMGVVLHGYVQFAGTPFNQEGNLKYAMLKAMESGAGIYFVLSYTKTELLKEDMLLSQNYSVRYDIWRSRLVEIYQEINEVLGDVQDKVIIDHEFLDAVRVPDNDELLKDIADEAQKQAEAIAAKIEREKLAVSTVKQTLNKLTYYAATFNAQYELINSSRTEGSELLQTWDALMAAIESETVTAEQIIAMNTVLSKYVAEPYAKMNRLLTVTESAIAVAKRDYLYLVGAGTEADVLASARAEMKASLQTYVSIMAKFHGADRSYNVPDELYDIFIDDAKMITANDFKTLLNEKGAYTDNNVSVSAEDLEGFIRGTVDLGELGARDLNDAFKAYLAATVNATKKIVDLDTIVSIANSNLTISVDSANSSHSTGSSATTPENAFKYTVDNSVVKVTYGQDMKTAYKTLLLNFNDYAVQVTIEGVTYTIDGYGYVVITHK